MALVVKNLPSKAEDVRDVGLTPGLGRSPGEELGNILQYSCLENPWTGSPVGSSPLGLQRVRQYSVNIDFSYWLMLHWQSCFNVSETVVPGTHKYELCHSQELFK